MSGRDEQMGWDWESYGGYQTWGRVVITKAREGALFPSLLTSNQFY